MKSREELQKDTICLLKHLLKSIDIVNDIDIEKHIQDLESNNMYEVVQDFEYTWYWIPHFLLKDFLEESNRLLNDDNNKHRKYFKNTYYDFSTPNKDIKPEYADKALKEAQ